MFENVRLNKFIWTEERGHKEKRVRAGAGKITSYLLWTSLSINNTLAETGCGGRMVLDADNCSQMQVKPLGPRFKSRLAHGTIMDLLLHNVICNVQLWLK